MTQGIHRASHQTCKPVSLKQICGFQASLISRKDPANQQSSVNQFPNSPSSADEQLCEIPKEEMQLTWLES